MGRKRRKKRGGGTIERKLIETLTMVIGLFERQ